MTPLSLLLVDSDPEGLETLTYGFERDGAGVNATCDLQAAPKLVGAASPSLVVVNLRPGEPAALEVIRRLRTGAHAIPHVAILALGPPDQQAAARSAGASDFLTTPAFIRDVVSAGKIALLGRRASGQDAPLTQARLSDYHGLFYLLRVMAATAHSAVVRLERGNRRGELRISEGRVVSANVEALQNLPALHHLLLWEEAALSLKLGAVPNRSQFNLTAQEVLDEGERFLRDFAHAARELGTSNTVYVPTSDRATSAPGLQPSQIAPLLRLFDGNRGMADVISESPFRIFDTVRMIKRLRDGGVLTAQSAQPALSAQAAKAARAPAPAKNGSHQSMLGEWAMVPDLRGVVGDRRQASRPQRPPPAAEAVTPIPLVRKKTGESKLGAQTAGEIVRSQPPTQPPSRPSQSPPMRGSRPDLEPTVQVRLDAHGMPLGEPVAPAAGATAVVRAPERPTPIQLRTRADSDARSQLDHTPLPSLDLPPFDSMPTLDGIIPPPVKRPTGPQARLDAAPAAHVAPAAHAAQGRKAPTGPQPRLEPAPAAQRRNTGPQPRLDPAPAAHKRTATGPQPRLEPAPAAQRRNTGPQPRLDPAPAAHKRTATGPQPRLEAPPPAKKVPTGPHPKLEAEPAVAPAPAHAKKGPSGPHAKTERAPAPRAGKVPTGQNLPPTAAFDDLEADFFAREADLYKRETVETFDDLDHPRGRKR